MNIKDIYDKDYFIRHKPRDAYKPSIATSVSVVMEYKPKRVLDVGCGHGFVVKKLLDCGVDVIGLDFSEYAGELIPDDRFIVAEAKELPFPDNSFDVVCSKGVLEHIPENELDQVISEMFRVGRNVVAEVCHKTKYEDGHITIHPKEWWRTKYPKIRFIVRHKGKLI